MGEIFSVIGKDIPQVGVKEKTTGDAKYTADLKLHGMLYAKVLRSPYPHARILGIDTTRAEKLKGVQAVICGRNTSKILYGDFISDQPVLVIDKVRFVGEPVAAVAATDEDIAEEALDLIEVEYEELKPVFDPERACLEDTPLIQSERFQGAYEFTRGDINKGFGESDLVIEGTFYSPRQEHAFLEPEGGIANIDLDGSIVICAGMHDSYLIPTYVSRTLGVNEHKVRAIFPPLGGSFGGKQSPSVHIHLALLTQMTNRPVRMLWSREESLLVHHKRHPARIKCELGLKREGEIVAYSADALLDGGPYTHQSPGTVNWGGQHAAGPYKISNLSITGKVVYTNNPSSGAFRGQGGPQFVTPLERMLDIAARRLGMDPVRIRRRNVLSQGDEPGLREAVLDSRVTLGDTIDRALEAAGPRPAPATSNANTKIRVGRGIACAMPLFDVSSRPLIDLMGTGAIVEMDHSGHIRIRVDVVEMGQGINTVLMQIVAEEFHAPIEKINIVVGDSFLTPKSGATVGSRSVYACGNAVRQAALKLKQRLARKAAEILGVADRDIRFESESVFDKNNEQNVLSIGELADRAFLEGINLTGYGWFVGTHAGVGHSFVTHVADVQVDEETGEVKVLKLITAHDAGCVLNPLGLRSQLRGAAIQMLGWALTEDMQTSMEK